MTFSEGPGGENHLAVAGEGRHPTKDHLLESASRAGIPSGSAARILNEVRSAIEQWEDFADEAGVAAGPAREVTEAIESVGLVRVRR